MPGSAKRTARRRTRANLRLHSYTMKQAARVGGGAVAFGFLFLGAYALLGASIFAPPVNKYKAVFTDAGGAVAGSTVLLSGVNVGQVQEVKLERAGRAVLVLAVKKGVQIPEGTQAQLTASLVGFGDRPVELVPPVTAGATLQPGAEIPGRIKSSLEGIIPDTSETMAELNKTLRATQKLIGDQELRNQVVTLLESSNKTVTEFGLLASRMNNVASQNEGTLRKTLTQASVIMADVSRTTNALARMTTDGRFEGKINTLMDNMNASIKEGNGLIKDMRATLNDPELKEPMKAIMANTQTMTDSGTRIAANAEVMTQNGIELSKKALEIADKASKLADELSELLKRVDTTFGKIANVGSSAAGIGRIETEANFIRETDPGRFRAEFMAKVPFGQETYTLGMWDAFESNKLIAQAGRNLGKDTVLRYGVFASQLGLGVDYRLAPGVWLRGDVFDVNEPRFDLRSQFDLGKDIRLHLGIDKVFSRSAPSIGLSLRR